MHPTKPKTSSDFPPWNLRTLRPKRTWLLWLFLLSFTSICLLLLLGGGRAPLELVKESDWRLLGGALLIHYSGFGVRGLRWKMLLKAMDQRLPFSYCTGLLISGWFVSAVVPARGGDLLRIGLLRAPLRKRPAVQPVPLECGVGSLLLERLLDMLAILTLGAGIGFGLLQQQVPAWVVSLYGTGLGLFIVLGVALLSLPHLWERLMRLWQNSLWHELIAFGARAVEQLWLLMRAPQIALWTMLFSFYIWICDALLLWLVMGSLDAWRSFSATAFVALSVDAFAAFPITPGGVGQIEAAYAGLLSIFELPPVEISATILLTRAISYWSFLILSGIITFVFCMGEILQRDSHIE